MDVSQRDDVAREIGEVEQGTIARIMDAVRAIDPRLGEYPNHNPVGHAASVDGRIDENSTAGGQSAVPVLIEEELALHVQRATHRDHESARRVAELLELMNKPEDAVQWWHRAAEYGDPDAIAYVRHILS